MSDTEFQDQGSLDQPSQAVEPQDRIKDVPAGPTEGGPVNPVKGRGGNPEEDAPLMQPQEADPEADADNSSASALNKVNEARESGEPLTDTLGGAEQGASTPAGTGTSAGAGAGSVDT